VIGFPDSAGGAEKRPAHIAVAGKEEDMSENFDIWPSPRPGEPTPALPGSERKIRVMIERALRRESLFHRRDGIMSGVRPTLPGMSELFAAAGRMESA
jgi:hypothetical protein